MSKEWIDTTDLEPIAIRYFKKTISMSFHRERVIEFYVASRDDKEYWDKSLMEAVTSCICGYGKEYTEDDQNVVFRCLERECCLIPKIPS